MNAKTIILRLFKTSIKYYSSLHQEKHYILFIRTLKISKPYFLGQGWYILFFISLIYIFLLLYDD